MKKNPNPMKSVEKNRKIDDKPLVKTPPNPNAKLGRKAERSLKKKYLREAGLSAEQNHVREGLLGSRREQSKSDVKNQKLGFL